MSDDEDGSTIDDIYIWRGQIVCTAEVNDRLEKIIVKSISGPACIRTRSKC